MRPSKFRRTAVQLLFATIGVDLVPVQMPGETIYNGIVLPSAWPPQETDQILLKSPAYLVNKPAVVSIDIGRQLFVDDFLIESSTLMRTFHQPEKYPGNPVLEPETVSEKTGGTVPGVVPGADGRYPLDSSACAFDDGVVYDRKDGRYKLWYMSGHLHDTALAYSDDGLHWTRPKFDVVPGTNIVIPYDPAFVRDSFSPWIDDQTQIPEERYKAFLYARGLHTYEGGYLYTSGDGIHWKQRARMKRNTGGDDTSIFYNPFRDRWALSLRVSPAPYHRARNYFEAATFMGLAGIERNQEVFWSRAEPSADPPDPTWIVQNPTQLYALAAMPYESVMLGLFTVHYGPENEICAQGNFPKLTQIKVAFSRDGFHWDRSDRGVFIAATKHDGDCDRGYLRATGTGCIAVGEKLYFYYCGFSGHNGEHRGMYAGGSQQVAILRRDGFASMDAGEASGQLTTRPVRFTGKFLYVNIDAPLGSLTVDVLDENGRIIAPFSAGRCMPVQGEGTKVRVIWEKAHDLGTLSGRPVRFRFNLAHGRLYAFWVSKREDGASNGFLASAGPSER